MGTIGQALREIRGDVSQAQLSHSMRVSASTIWRHERDEQDPTASSIQAYVNAIGVPLVVTPDGWSVHEGAAPSFLPCYGKVPCGHPILIEDPPESEVNLVDLTNGIWREGKHYLLIADGDSMKGAGIRDGDWLIVERRQAQLGNVVVATLNGSTMVKRMVTDDETDDLVLAPANPAYEPRQVTEFDECAIQGVVIGRLRYSEVG